jgi:aminoglycoside phosphotransferase (APT) family kinase protein
MAMAYQGELAPDDPLYSLLADTVLREVLGLSVEHPIFDVFAVDPNGIIYRYLERTSGADMACKFFGNRPGDAVGMPSQQHTADVLRREYGNLQRVWDLGMNRPPYRVVRPLAFDEERNYVLVEEYVSGPALDTFLKQALHNGAHAPLAERLADLAAFLAQLHSRSQLDQPADRAQGFAYLEKVTRQLVDLAVIDSDRQRRLDELRGGWAHVPALASALRVLVHGDVTPINIVFGDDHQVIAIDLERLREDDAAVDLGIVVAELRHAFLRTAHAAQAADTFVEHFFQSYATARGIAGPELDGLGVRVRFFAGAMLLRIGRNDWLDVAYRRALAQEAEQWLSRPGQKLFSSISTTH